MEYPPQIAATPAREKQSRAQHDSREEEAARLRGKIVGVRIRQCRMAASRSIEDCAEHLGVSPQLATDWEYGDRSPSQPQLERLSSYLNVSASTFLQGNEPAAIQDGCAKSDGLPALRQQLLGGLLRVARGIKGISIEQLSEITAIDRDLVQEYEYGERMIPINHLLILGNSLDRDPEYFLGNAQGTGVEAGGESAANSPESTSVNDSSLADDHTAQGIITLAIAFSQIPPEELRGIADALLLISNAKSGSSRA